MYSTPRISNGKPEKGKRTENQGRPFGKPIRNRNVGFGVELQNVLFKAMMSKTICIHFCQRFTTGSQKDCVSIQKRVFDRNHLTEALQYQKREVYVAKSRTVSKVKEASTTGRGSTKTNGGFVFFFAFCDARIVPCQFFSFFYVAECENAVGYMSFGAKRYRFTIWSARMAQTRGKVSSIGCLKRKTFKIEREG